MLQWIHSYCSGLVASCSPREMARPYVVSIFDVSKCIWWSRNLTNLGSFFYNYKGTFSTVFLVVMEAKHWFHIIDVGSYGRSSNWGTLANSPFGQALQDRTLNLPEDALLTGAEHHGPLPHVFIPDEAFPLWHDLIRPFPGTQPPRRKRVFNYWLSWTRLVVEETFGILTIQWWMYHHVFYRQSCQCRSLCQGRLRSAQFLVQDKNRGRSFCSRRWERGLCTLEHWESEEQQCCMGDHPCAGDLHHLLLCRRCPILATINLKKQNKNKDPFKGQTKTLLKVTQI